MSFIGVAGTSFLFLIPVHYCVTILLFIPSPVGGHLHWFKFLTFVNEAALNMSSMFLVCIVIHLGIYRQVKLLGRRVGACLFSVSRNCQFSKMAIPFFICTSKI